MTDFVDDLKENARMDQRAEELARAGDPDKRCRNAPCERSADTTVLIFGKPVAVCYPCGGKIRCHQEHLPTRHEHHGQTAEKLGELLKGSQH